MTNSNKFNSLGDSEKIHEPKDHSNIYVAFAVGAMITICAVIYVGVSVIEAVNY